LPHKTKSLFQEGLPYPTRAPLRHSNNRNQHQHPFENPSTRHAPKRSKSLSLSAIPRACHRRWSILTTIYVGTFAADDAAAITTLGVNTAATSTPAFRCGALPCFLAFDLGNRLFERLVEDVVA
ncbi:unnamed protein product, partial [Ectocarpus sp. 13 AM-2016]